MKIDGATLARANAKKKSNLQFEDEGHKVIQDTLDVGNQIEAMASFIQSVHNKNPKEAHQHMMSYQRQVQNVYPAKKN